MAVDVFDEWNVCSTTYIHRIHKVIAFRVLAMAEQERLQ
jgi:hypothetical protein